MLSQLSKALEKFPTFFYIIYNMTMNETHKLRAQQLWDDAGCYMYEQLDDQGKLEAGQLADVITQSLLCDLAMWKQQADEFSWAGGDYRKAPTVTLSSAWKDIVVPTTRKECELYRLFLATGLTHFTRNSLGLGLPELWAKLDFEGDTSLNSHLQKMQAYKDKVNDWANRFIGHGVGALVDYWFGAARQRQLPISEQHPIVLRLEQAGWKGLKEAYLKVLAQPDSSSSASLRSELEHTQPKTTNNFVQVAHSIFDWMLSGVANLAEALSKPESTLRRDVEASIIDAVSQEMERVVDVERKYGYDAWIADPKDIGFDMRKALAWYILFDYKDTHRPLKELANEAGISFQYVREFGVRCEFLPKRGRPPKLLK